MCPSYYDLTLAVVRDVGENVPLRDCRAADGEVVPLGVHLGDGRVERPAEPAPRILVLAFGPVEGKLRGKGGPLLGIVCDGANPVTEAECDAYVP